MKFENPKIQATYEKFVNFFSEFAAAPEPTKFKEEKLADGVTIIQYDGDVLAQGMPVNVVTPEGILPIPDGEYQLADGAKLVTSGGLVAEYEPAAEAVPEGETTDPNAAPMTPQGGSMEAKPAPKRVIKSQVEEHVFHLEIEDVEPIKIDFSSIVAPVMEENKKLKEIVKDMFSLVGEISKAPAAEPTEKPKDKFNINDHRSDFKKDLQKLEDEYNKQF